MGLGLILGSPFGASGKYWFNEKLGLDAAFGAINGDFACHSTIIVHLKNFLSNFIPNPQKGNLTFNLGMGLRLRTRDKADDQFGIRFLGGASYYFDNAPLEIFAEAAPILRLTPDLGSLVDGGVGIRYYFHTAGSRYPKAR